ncbi:MAG: hypothetical protein HYT98_00915 [Candidatus Sungbacteria bacterium]|nr:hypothetical protein [Candidatus Sungbacteria bacterium]
MKTSNNRGYISLLVIVAAAVIVIGGAFYFYNRAINTISRSTPSGPQGFTQKTTPSASPTQVPSNDKIGSSSFKFSCSQIASAKDVNKLFLVNTNLASDPMMDAFQTEKIIFCQYGNNNNINISANVIYADSAFKMLDSYEALGKLGGASIDNIDVGKKGFYFYMDKEKNLERSLMFADSSGRFFVTLMADEKFTREQLIAFAKLINNNLRF